MAAQMAVSKTLYIDNREIIKFSKELEKMGKNTLPKVVAFTLNNAAFDVKQKSMPASTKSKFTIRQQNFFKATSGVDKASASIGIDGMEATVGFEAERAKANKYAVKGLEQQEESGVIKKRKFIPLNSARKGGNATLIRPNARLSKIKNIVKTSRIKGKNTKEKFIKAAIIAGKGGYVLSGKKNLLFKIESTLQSNLRSKKTFIKATPLYKYNRSGTIAVKKTAFMKTAADNSAQKIEKFFIENAKRILG
jgi:hypothetical protein